MANSSELTFLVYHQRAPIETKVLGLLLPMVFLYKFSVPFLLNLGLKWGPIPNANKYIFIPISDKKFPIIPKKKLQKDEDQGHTDF